jgi:tetratricopeptide (TPR) repeat protein
MLPAPAVRTQEPDLEADAQHLRVRAEALLKGGQAQAAIAAYRSLLSLQPDNAEAWFNLGYLLRHAGAHAQAVSAYQQALEHGISGPEQVYLNLAVIHADHLRDDASAHAALQQALRLAPDYAPAWLNLGNLQEERGQRVEAIHSYRQLLARTTGADEAVFDLRLEALARLGHLTPPTTADDPLLQTLRQCAGLARPMDERTRANVLFSLGRALDRIGRYKEAFQAFTDGKHVAHRHHRPYDRSASARHLAAALASAGHATTAAGEPAEPSAPGLIFVCGMFRSGSTLLEQVLGTCPQVVTCGELDLIPRIAAAMEASATAPESLAEADAKHWAQWYRSELERRFPGSDKAGWLVDKRVDNQVHLGLILRLFPDARIVHTQRNPMDNALSIYMQHIAPSRFPYAGTLEDIAHTWVDQQQLMQHWQRQRPASVHTFDYDAFVQAPETAVAALGAWLGLPLQQSWHDFHLLGNTVKTASYWQVRRPLYQEASGRWRHYRQFLGPVQEVLRSRGISWGGVSAEE